MPRSDLVILREEFTKVASENIQFRRVIAALKEDRVRMQRNHEAELASMRAAYEAELASMRAAHRTELAGCNARIAMLKERIDGAESRNKRLAASDRAHNSAHASPATRTWHAERRKREAVRERHARQTAWRPPGRSYKHEGVTRKMKTNRPDEHRWPKSCGTYETPGGAPAKQLSCVIRSGAGSRRSS